MNLSKQELAVLMSTAGIQSHLNELQSNPEFLQLVGMYATATNAQKIEMLSEFSKLAEPVAAIAADAVKKARAEIELLKAQA